MNHQIYYKKLVEGNNLNILDKIVLVFLGFISVLYKIVLKIRDYFYKIGIFKSVKIDIPVISIGNITLGGTGKTSICITLAKMLYGKKLNIAILSRGYKGNREKNFGVVNDGNRILLSQEEAGDEPYLLVKKLPFVKILVGKNRAKSADYAQKNFNSNLIILDDGFQQKKLFSDINIVLLDAKNPFGNYKLFPGGILREPIMKLKKSDIVIITNINLVQQYQIIINEVKSINPYAAIFTSQYIPVKITDLAIKAEIKKEDIVNKSILAVTGIANPEYFKEMIEKWLNKKIKIVSYPDHYQFTKNDFKEIKNRAKNYACDLILITEKDAVKFVPLEIPVYVIEAEMKINEEQRFMEKLSELITLH